MTDQQVLVLSQIAAGLIKTLGMFIHDLWQLKYGTGQVYEEGTYEKVIEEHALGWNTVLGLLRD